MNVCHVFPSGTRLPEKGATTGIIIGAIIGVIIILAAIGSGIAMYRRRKKSMSEYVPVCVCVQNNNVIINSALYIYFTILSCSN